MKADAMEYGPTPTSLRWVLTSLSISTEDTELQDVLQEGTSDWVGYCHRQQEVQALAKAEFCPLPSLALGPVPSCISGGFTTLNVADTRQLLCARTKPWTKHAFSHPVLQTPKDKA